MYGCFAATTIIALNDQPQAVIDAATRTTPSSSRPATTTGTAPTLTATAQPDGSPSTSGGHIGVGIIIGAVVGGLGLLFLILVVVGCCLIRRRRNRNKRPAQSFQPPLSQGAGAYTPPMSTMYPPYPMYEGQGAGGKGSTPFDPQHAYGGRGYWGRH